MQINVFLDTDRNQDLLMW